MTCQRIGHASWVCGSDPVAYTVRVRRKGHRNYEILGTHNKLKRALIELVTAMLDGTYKRGDVLSHSRKPSPYDPLVIAEMVMGL